MLRGEGIVLSVDAVVSVEAVLRYAAFGFWKTSIPIDKCWERKIPQS